MSSSTVPKPPTPIAATPWMPFALCFAMISLHYGVWLAFSSVRGIPLVELLNRWDSDHYSSIVEHGYRYPLYVFLPLYPGIVWAVSRVGGSTQVVGAVLSTVALLGFVFCIAKFRAEPGPR